MRTLLMVAILAGADFAFAAAAPARAFDSTQFCQAVTQWARAAAGDAGTWVDRSTRNDGVEIICDRKLVHFKRYSTASVSASRDLWKDTKTEEWQSATCSNTIWREAVENGWLVSATVTTASGQRIWFACQPGGIGFHRVMP